MQAFHFIYIGGFPMRASRVSPEEQYRMIMECRRSGLSDQQWCLNNGIKPGTFYNWVKRLRQRGRQDIPAATGRTKLHSNPQEVVKIEVEKTGDPQMVLPETYAVSNAMELSVGTVHLRIPNGTDPVLLSQTLKVLREFTC
ncbi:MAG: transposase [Massilibacteroides sp.]|nr:transposase [Massilibacteroides sp.]